MKYLGKNWECEMTDYGYPLRQKFIAESATLEAKRAELRARMHETGRYFLGEEIKAQKHGGSVIVPRKVLERK